MFVFKVSKVRVVILVVALNAVSFAGKSAKSRSRSNESEYKDVVSSNSRSSDTVDWDPESCWDCSSQDELVGMFFSGLLCSIPILTFLIIRKTRAKNSLRTKPQLDI